MLRKKQGFICIALLVIAILVMAVGDHRAVTVSNTIVDENKVAFSHNSGFYSETIVVELEAQDDATIIYTLDGSVPSQDNEAVMVYNSEEDILLECTEQEQVYTIRAVAYTEGENAQSTEVSTSSYIVGANVKERYTTPVLLLSGNPDDFYDEEDGILIGENRLLKGIEHEKEVNIALFDEQGTEVISQNGGFRIYGAYSRGKNQPSFRLYARTEYGVQNDFEYMFFDNLYNYQNVLFPDYKRVIVRNSGDDNGYAYLRSELSSRLAIEAGFQDAQSASPVCVYINGEYYGQYWFVTNYDEWYFANKYGEYDGQMVVLEGEIATAYAEEDEDEVTKQIREEYYFLHGDMAYCDLNTDEKWQELNAKIDVENLLQYMAIQHYANNRDSFVSNFRTYRYYSPEEEYQEGTVFDGRYRFLLFDMDETLGFSDESAASVQNITYNLNHVEYYNVLFSNLMRRPEAREYYIRYYLSLANYYFAPEQSLWILDEMHTSREEELQYLYNETNLLEGNLNTPENVDYTHALEQIDVIRQFLIDRPQVAIEDISNAFGLEQTYELSILNQNQANISVDFATFHDTSYIGTYFGDVPVAVSVQPRYGYKFDYWLIEGEMIAEQSFVITADMVQNGILDIECVTSVDENADLSITAIKSKGRNDYIEVTNYAQTPIILADYRLSDDMEGENSSSLPALKIEAGESITIYCEGYTGVEALGMPGVNFDIKVGETIILYGKNGEMLQSVEVPDLGSKEGVYKMDSYSGVFSEIVSE